MKLDLSGFESIAPLIGASDGLSHELPTAPSFDLPVTADVSFDCVLFCH